MLWLVSALLLAPQSTAPNPHRQPGAALASGDMAAAQEHQKSTESASAPTSAEAQIHDLIDEVSRSGRVLEVGDLSDRLGSRRQIAPGRPPLLEFRYLEGASRHRFGNLDLVIDDAGH
jgi:hypothetical protein